MVSHWAWTDDGWLSKNGYRDFAGSGVVHLTGGICALVGTFCMEPRLGRFTKQGKPIDMAGHSVPLAGLGGFILLFGFLAFNGGSQLAISKPGDVETVGLAIVNTIIGGCSAQWWLRSPFDQPVYPWPKMELLDVSQWSIDWNGISMCRMQCFPTMGSLHHWWSGSWSLHGCPLTDVETKAR